jgi:hypothetical protein
VVPTSAGPPSLRGLLHASARGLHRAYVDSGIAFRPQRVCRLEALVVVGGEQLCPHLFFLPSLSDFLGRTSAYYGTWVR